MILPENIKNKTGNNLLNETFERKKSIDGERDKISINKINEVDGSFENKGLIEMMRRTEVTVCPDGEERVL